MKKFKLLTACMATTVGIVPMIPTLTSCSATKIAELASEIKDATIQHFINISKNVHRSVWNEQEAFDYIITTMQSLGYKDYSGRDYWSYTPEARKKITKETGIEWGDPYRPFPNYGNVWYDIPASKGMDKAPKIIIQSHMDSQMDFVNAAAKEKWKNDGINISFDRDNDIITSDEKTSLGADGGMGISLLLSIAKFQKKFKHGGIRLLFTAGESEATEHYAAGASFLTNDQIYKGKEIFEGAVDPDISYLEIDSTKPFGEKNEFAGVISVSGLYNKTIYRSVGGINEVSFSDNTLVFNKEDNKIKQGKIFNITIDNLHGGKSSKDIDSGYANALQMLMRMLHGNNKPIQLISASSAPGAYNIASTATCTFASTMTLNDLKTKRDAIFNEFKEKCKNENWDAIKFDVTEVTDKTYTYGLSAEQSENFINIFDPDELDFGATEWFDEQKTNVKTSYNHGKLTLAVEQEPSDTKKSAIEVYFVCRSNVTETVESWSGIESKLMINLSKKLICLYDGETAQEQLRAHISNILNPCWEGTEENKLIDTLVQGYKKVGITPKVVNNHGWVEIGAFTPAFKDFDKYLTMASVGIEINNSGELSESVYTDSLNSLNKSILYTLINIDKTV